MFGFGKQQIHESVELQKEDLEGLPPEEARLFLSGRDCDQVPDGFGEFGRCVTNPIPVNGVLGIFKYFNKLRTSEGVPLLFHQIGSDASSVSKKLVDVYEVVSMDGETWDILFFDKYHPRRSNLCPSGFELVPLQRHLKRDLPVAYGVDVHIENFPEGLPDSIEYRNKQPVFARHVREALAEASFTRPTDHLVKLKPCLPAQPRPISTS